MILLVTGMLSCNKLKLPRLKVNTPADGQIFTAPEQIIVDAEMSDPDILFGQEILVTKTSPVQAVVLDYIDQDHPPEHIVKSFVSEANTSYRIVVKATGPDGVTADTIRVSTN